MVAYHIELSYVCISAGVALATPIIMALVIFKCDVAYSFRDNLDRSTGDRCSSEIEPFRGSLMLNAAVVGADTFLCRTQERRDLIELLLSEITQIFPQVSYELDLGSRTANAQALARGSVRAVRLYGGLALHPGVGQDSLVFALLHETGHHFAAGPRFALDPMLACDCAADEWAVTVGAMLWLRRFERSFDICKAIDGLEAVVASTCADFPSGHGNSEDGPRAWRGCWTADWQVRKSCLSGRRPMKTGKRCRIS